MGLFLVMRSVGMFPAMNYGLLHAILAMRFVEVCRARGLADMFLVVDGFAM